MASAARVHAAERGKELASRTLIAFGGAAPLHAARVARKLGIRHVIVPSGAGVGSAVGFLLAPIAYEVVRSRHVRLADPDRAALQAMLDAMEAEALEVVAPAARGAALATARTADMRYVGQGHEVTVQLPDGPVDEAFVAEARRRFAQRYEALYTRGIPSLDIEVLSWAVRVCDRRAPPERCAPPAPDGRQPPAVGVRPVFDPAAERRIEARVVDRRAFAQNVSLAGPALIVEDETTTLVPAGFVAAVNAHGHIELTAAAGGGGA